VLITLLAKYARLTCGKKWEEEVCIAHQILDMILEPVSTKNKKYNKQLNGKSTLFIADNFEFETTLLC